MSSGRLSRPSSATSHSSRHSQVSHSSRSNSSSGELTLECKAAYLSVFDDVHDLITSQKKFVLVLQQTGRNPLPKVVDRYWGDERDSMTFSEFVDICRKIPVTTKDDLMKAFRKIDVNGDGYISLDELYKIMTTKGEKLSHQEVKTMIGNVDENKDGRLDYKEFCRMFMSTTDECKKLSLKAMERKERKKKRNETGLTSTPRREKAGGSVSGSQLSLQSTASDWTKKEDNEEDEDKDVEKDEEKAEEEEREEALSKRKESVTSHTGSHVSLQSQQSLSRKNEKRLSQSSLPAGRSGSKQSLLSIDVLPKPSPRGNKKKPAIGRLNEPSKLQNWHHAKSKGCFFVDDDKGHVSHQYQATVTKDTNIWLTIQPLKIGDAYNKGLVDTAVFILPVNKEDDDDAFVAFTEQRDSKGCHGVQCRVRAGTYSLVPFTTGCRFRPRQSEPSREVKLISTDKGSVTLTKPFKKVLEEIFEMSDLDGNNLLNRLELNWFNLRTSEDEVADDEWQIVEETVQLKNGEITKEGFIRLNELEAEDNNGDTEDLWITVNNMGYNRSLERDEAYPFMLDVYSEAGEVTLKVTGLENPGKALENAICESVILKGVCSRVKAMRDLMLHTYVGDGRATIVVENKSHTRVTLEMDCSKSRNCISNHGNLVFAVTVPARSKVVAVHLVPENDKEEWSVHCAEAILK